MFIITIPLVLFGDIDKYDHSISDIPEHLLNYRIFGNGDTIYTSSRLKLLEYKDNSLNIIYTVQTNINTDLERTNTDNIKCMYNFKF